MHPYAPYRCIILEPYKISTCLRFIDGGSIGSTPGGPGTLPTQYYHHTLNYSSQTTLHYVATDHWSEDKVPAIVLPS